MLRDEDGSFNDTDEVNIDLIDVTFLILVARHTRMAL